MNSDFSHLFFLEVKDRFVSVLFRLILLPRQEQMLTIHLMLSNRAAVVQLRVRT